MTQEHKILTKEYMLNRGFTNEGAVNPTIEFFKEGKVNIDDRKWIPDDMKDHPEFIIVVETYPWDDFVVINKLFKWKYKWLRIEYPGEFYGIHDQIIFMGKVSSIEEADMLFDKMLEI